MKSNLIFIIKTKYINFKYIAIYLDYEKSVTVREKGGIAMKSIKKTIGQLYLLVIKNAKKPHEVLPITKVPTSSLNNQDSF